MSYLASGDELEVMRAAWDARLPVLLRGPTGCGKTRLVEHLAEELGVDLITVSCHEDMLAADLVGRHLVEGGETVWRDGPLTRAVREGAICYLDEIVEARADATVVVHSLADHRRRLFVERRDEHVDAAPGFMLVASYNPGYQSLLKDLKPSTRQRFVAIDLDFPAEGVEEEVVQAESGADADDVASLVALGRTLRAVEEPGFAEVASTRTLIAAARLARTGLPLRRAAQVAVAGALTDDVTLGRAVTEVIDTYLA